MNCRLDTCASICLECFSGGDHEGHDTQMYVSASGGACDCGNASVWRPSGFCSRVRDFYLAAITSTVLHMYVC